MDGTVCSYRGCKRSYSGDKDVSFFAFPSDPERRRLWMENCGMMTELYGLEEKELRRKKVCSEHFEIMDFSRPGSRAALKDCAIPIRIDSGLPTAKPDRMFVQRRLRPKSRKKVPKDGLKGCRLPVQIVVDGKEHWQMAEILQVKRLPDSKKSYYVHFLEFNSRLDAWMSEDKLDFSKVQFPNIHFDAPIRVIMQGYVGATTQEEPQLTQLQQLPLGNPNLNGPISSTLRSGNVPPPPIQNPIEKRIKNVELIELGRYRIKPWYFSPYPPQFNGLPCLFICEFCLGCHSTREVLAVHLRTVCTRKRPPGKEVYRKQGISIFEIDGAKEQLYLENLHRLGKLFLEHKNFVCKADQFLFYVMTQFDTRGFHLVGYFSKVKADIHDFNVACILTLPPYQGKGFGNMLIQFSYLLSKIEGKQGTPEKPLSDLGLLSYRSYWSHTIMGILLKVVATPPEGESKNVGVSISDICNTTSMKKDDVISTLGSLGICFWFEDGIIIVLTQEMRKEYEEVERSRRMRIDPKCLKWSLTVWVAPRPEVEARELLMLR
ncbi:unnamed protein product [Orchesella dallaii]|uniref:histone acetyltransferase n=1 Tax=Orchesella dallaii TaxID=48710 RepID=A0ABP1RPN0_9HEXA